MLDINELSMSGEWTSRSIWMQWFEWGVKQYSNQHNEWICFELDELLNWNVRLYYILHRFTKFSTLWSSFFYKLFNTIDFWLKTLHADDFVHNSCINNHHSPCNSSAFVNVFRVWQSLRSSLLQYVIMVGE